ncbi:hypothetical protein [Aestuariicoccus sp. MJ-SS9]|uniref:hypothetical protein n=1 Tax=Aestuariicoccus sp. MJ-SS9 TaxID=3079855 RepID=UPI00290B4D46|nr:hypothetical protein [Aestuariicoccus sp. MJ-SS9]MDU8913434.1 hypothetical protein [Aestuariicoccus sp. MJ-SS9]
MKSEHSWRLVSLRSGRNGVPKRNENFKATEEEAIELISQGNAWPVEKTEKPPKHLLSMLQEQVSKIDLLGPATNDPSFQAAVAEELFPSGLRQDFSDGRAVNWQNGKAGLRKLVGSRLSERHVADFDLFALFRFVTIEMPSRWRFPSDACYSQLYCQEYARDIPGDPGDFSVELHTSLDWSGDEAFAHDVLCLQGNLEELLSQALADGRIIAAETARAGERFVPANIAGKITIRDFSDEHSFALSSDLPEGLARRDVPLHFRRKQASRTIEAIFKHYEGSGRRCTASNLQTLVRERYKLTPNAAKDAWAGANVPKEGFENMPKEQKVSIDELRQLNIIERENGDPPDIISS